jgi:DnaK suppressor protein
MTSKERNSLKERILSQISDLTVEIKSHEETSRPVAPDNAIGRLTRMEAINARSISEERLGSARMRLTRLQNTLKRIDTPRFGLCSVCEDPIPLNRLMLMPETTRCVDCVKE